ncbi:VWA domain-containing protein [Endomicrobium sp. AH-315-J14]|nr:VWA domain-containing protein [Endomicrobium sp. AH-315-J14]
MPFMTFSRLRLGAVLSAQLTFMALVLFVACSDSGGSDDDGSLVTSSPGSGGSSTTGFAQGGAGPAQTSGGVGGACNEVSEKAENITQPTDIIIAIDQSGSMDEETKFVQAQVAGFAKQIIDAMIDVHVILIAGPQGTENGICVPAPLGSGNCPDDNVDPTFTHVPVHVGSNDALVQIIANYKDYKDYLRPGASKHLIVISDDDSSLPAMLFHGQFTALDPANLSDFVFHAIVSDEDDPGTFSCLANKKPCCDFAADEGKVYKKLVADTQGVYGDLCQQNFQPVWDEVSAQVIENTKIGCEWPIPEPPEGEAFAADLVNVEYAIGGGMPVTIGKVDDILACAGVAGGWYYDNPADPKTIIACPQTCEILQNAEDAIFTIKFGCHTIPAEPA